VLPLAPMRHNAELNGGGFLAMLSFFFAIVSFRGKGETEIRLGEQECGSK